jgi:hypothetical protein
MAVAQKSSDTPNTKWSSDSGKGGKRELFESAETSISGLNL